MKVVGLIPARFNSTRFPGKPLVNIKGKSMIRRVYERCCLAQGLQEVWVGTDDERILNEVNDFNGNVMMTSTSHQNGTERCAEMSEKLDADYFINIQGDEPFISPHQIDQLVEVLDGKIQIATLVSAINENATLDDPNIMKVVIDRNDFAIYFSRNCIPYVRDFDKEEWLQKHNFWKHIGMYAYKSNVLKEIVDLPLSSLEKAESLEQLRWIENGYSIKVGRTDIESVSIDVPEDLKKMESHLNAEG